MHKFIIVVVFPMVLIGCAKLNISNDYVLQEKSPNGVAVLSLTYSGACVGGAGIHLGGKDVGLLRLAMDEQELLDWGKWCEEDESFWRRFPEGSHQSEIGRLFVIEFPAGEHQFIAIHIGGAFSGRFSIPFSVLPGKYVYLGNIHIQAGRIEYSTAEIVLGVLAGASGGSRFRLKIILRDLRERDLSQLIKKYPNIRKEQLVVKLLEKIEEWKDECDPALDVFC